MRETLRIVAILDFGLPVFLEEEMKNYLFVGAEDYYQHTKESNLPPYTQGYDFRLIILHKTAILVQHHVKILHREAWLS
jgi:hypothetical protein